MTDTTDEAAEQAEYQALRFATDPVEAFNLFVKRNVPANLRSHFAGTDDNEAEYVRRAIRAAMVPRVVVASGGSSSAISSSGGFPGGGGGPGTVVNGVAVRGGYGGGGGGYPAPTGDIYEVDDDGHLRRRGK